MRSVKNNVFWLYISIFISGLYFDRALWVLYLGERGMNMAQVGILEAILHLAIVLFEVPTGIIADLYGRKRSLLIGSFISLGYALFMLISGNFFLFSLAFAFHGLAVTFRSGADHALLYDSLKQSNKDTLYTKIVGNQTAIILVSLSLAQIIGGFMAEVNWNIVYISTIAFQLLGIIPVLMLTEPKHNQSEDKVVHKKPMLTMWRDQLTNSYKIWKDQPPLRLPMVLFVLIMMTMTVIIFYSQEYFSRLGFRESEIGIIFMAEALLGATAAKLAHIIEKKFSFHRLIGYTYLLFTVFLVFFSVVQGWLSVICMFILSLLLTNLEPIFSNFVQAKIGSDVRATFFSLISLVTSIGIMIAFPLFGFVVDLVGFQYSFLGLVIILLFAGVYARVKKQWDTRKGTPS